MIDKVRGCLALQNDRSRLCTKNGTVSEPDGDTFLEITNSPRTMICNKPVARPRCKSWTSSQEEGPCQFGQVNAAGRIREASLLSAFLEASVSCWDMRIYSYITD
jgi:hypothetical protein